MYYFLSSILLTEAAVVVLVEIRSRDLETRFAAVYGGTNDENGVLPQALRAFQSSLLDLRCRRTIPGAIWAVGL